MSKQKKFFSGKGYYIALILGAIAIGVSGYLYYANQTQDVTASNQDPAALVGAVTPDSQPTGENTEPSNQQPQKPQKRVRPVDGDTVVSHALDMLCYNQTTRDWRTHAGIDIAAQAGTQVVAAADGTVHAVYEDETMGLTLVLHHGDSYTTTYASLEEVTVKAGDTVAAGQKIGTVGASALMEAAIGDHLHFAVTCQGKHMDPNTFLED